MLIEMADNNIVFMAMVTCTKEEAHDMDARVHHVLRKTFRADEYQLISPFEKPDYYQSAMFSAIASMAASSITWKWENKALYLIDTFRRVGGVKESKLRVLRLIKFSEDTLKRMKQGAGNGSARSGSEGTENQGSERVIH